MIAWYRDLDNAAIIPNNIPSAKEVVGSGDGNPEKSDDDGWQW